MASWDEVPESLRGRVVSFLDWRDYGLVVRVLGVSEIDQVFHDGMLLNDSELHEMRYYTKETQVVDLRSCEFLSGPCLEAALRDWTQLRELKLHRVNVMDDVLMGLVETRPRLEVLEISGCSFAGEETIERLIKTFCNKNLTTLKLCGFRRLNRQHIELLHSQNMPNLQYLNLEENTGVTTYVHTLTSPVPELAIGRNCKLSGLEMEAPTKNDPAYNSLLRILDLSNAVWLSEEPLVPFLRNFNGLRTISLNGCVNIKNLNIAFEDGCLDNLETLELKVCARLDSLKLRNLKSLKHLELVGCKALAEVRLVNLEKLQVVDFSLLESLEKLHLAYMPSLKQVLAFGCPKFSPAQLKSVASNDVEAEVAPNFSI